MPVVKITDEAHFHTHMANAGGKLVVVDFTAKWCGPCQMIGPIFEKLSNRFPQATFLKVDVDECDSLTAAHGVTAMPTFIFFRAKTKVATLQGANPHALEAKVTELAGQSDDTSGGGPSSSNDSKAYGPHIDLTSMIMKSGCECLNESDAHPLAHCLDGSARYLESDCDEQLIMTLAFSQPVKLHSLKIRAPADGHGPATMKLFINQPRSLDFDRADSIEPVQVLEITPDDLMDDAKPMQLKYVKFQNVNSLTIFVKDNQGQKDTTRITQLCVIGSPVAVTNMNEFKRVGGKQGEAH